MTKDVRRFVEQHEGKIRPAEFQSITAAQEYTSFYNAHRPHQGLGNRTVAQAATGPPDAELLTDTEVGRVRCRRFLGDLLRHYYRAA